MKQYLAEFLGTCVLSLGVLLSLGAHFPIPTPVVAGMIVGLFVFTIGALSGAHLNPAITIGIWSINKIKTDEAVKYIAAQCLGAMVALYIGMQFITPATLQISNSFIVAAGEALGTFLLAFGVATVVHGKVNDTIAGFVIGGSLTIGAMIASVASNGVLNPAVALGINSFSIAYIIGPIVGSVAAFQLAKFLHAK